MWACGVFYISGYFCHILFLKKKDFYTDFLGTTRRNRFLKKRGPVGLRGKDLGAFRSMKEVGLVIWPTGC